MRSMDSTDQSVFWKSLHASLPFPDSYLIADCETSGGSHEKDVVVDIGFSYVQDRMLLRSRSIMLDWTTVPGFDVALLAERLAKMADVFAEKGKVYPYTVEYLRSMGVPAIEGLGEAVSVLKNWTDSGMFVAGHNFLNFDKPLLHRQSDRWLGLPVFLDDNKIVDTGFIEKASQCAQYPWPGERRAEWYHRIQSKFAKNIKWSLDSHCQQRYKLATAREMQQQHTAAFDTVLVYRLIEAQRSMN